MKKKNRPIKKTLAVLTSVFLTLLITLLIALQWPGLWLGPHTLRFFQRQMTERIDTIDIQWQNVEVRTNVIGFLSNRIQISFQDFCFQKKGQIRSCFETLLLGFAYDLPKMQITELGPIRGGQGSLTYWQQESNPDNDLTIKIPELPEWISQAELKTIHIEIQPYRIHLAEREFQGELLIDSYTRSQATGDQQTIALKIQDLKWGQAQTAATSLSDKLEGPWKIQFSTNLQFLKNSRLLSNGRIHPTTDGFELNADLKYLSDLPKANLRLVGHYHNKSLSSRINGTVQAGPQISIAGCQLDFQVESQTFHISSDCPIHLPLQQFNKNKVQQVTQDLPDLSIGAVLHAHFQTPYPIQTSNLISGEILLDPQLKLRKLISENGSFRTWFQLRASDWPDFESLESNLNFSLQLNDFQKLARLLEETSLAIPSPFSVLEGTIRLHSRGDLNESGGRFNSTLVTNLHSEFQRVETTFKSQFNLAIEQFEIQKLSVNSDWQLRKVHLALPPFESLPPKQIFPDRRIQESIANHQKINDRLVKRWPFLNYQVRLRTIHDDSLRLTSNYTEIPIEFEFDLIKKDRQPLTGTLSMDPIQYEISGFENQLGGLDLNLRVSSHHTLVQGEVTDPQGEDQSKLIFAKDPMDSLLRPQPQLPIPFFELATIIGLDRPLSIAISDVRRPNRPTNQTTFNSIPIQIRRRF